ncbi:substrate-binding domain-containing protein [candidate division KSB3 bacterium]|uniref:Substrate-binding domain-containing protein n=1 Tax=candidate division KSB3 bacterium TaxID=2044937 RepID=A0A9D5JTY2_9BACT|nr:substrate-binding domain-containing protein [candidate division KSB3 bacterium]MBD3324040.1 substrate-binding domain-containing protein [candidate division KSB3 bacterium]
MKKLCVVLLITTLLIPSIALAQDKITIGLTLPSLSHPFFVYLQKNVMDEAEKLGVEVIAIDAENVAARQMSIVEDFIARDVDGVLMSPIGQDALVPAVESLNEVGIPVATVDRKVEGGELLVHVGADNVEGGRVAARYIIEQLGGTGSVIELEGTPGASPAIDRKAGFDEVIATSDIEILVSQTAKFERAMGQSVMENLLQVHKDFQGVFGANDEMILGAIEAMQAAEVDPATVVTVGYDAIPDALTYIKEGRLDATIEQFPGEQARKGLRFLVEYIKDGTEPPSKEVYITPVAITQDNLDQAEHKVE